MIQLKQRHYTVTAVTAYDNGWLAGFLLLTQPNQPSPHTCGGAVTASDKNNGPVKLNMTRILCIYIYFFPQPLYSFHADTLCL
jgi:hypothetical protein